MSTITGRTVFFIGDATGRIGAALARRLAKSGARLAHGQHD